MPMHAHAQHFIMSKPCVLNPIKIVSCDHYAFNIKVFCSALRQFVMASSITVGLLVCTLSEEICGML